MDGLIVSLADATGKLGLTLPLLIYTGIAFFIAGSVKGLAGLGLPMVVLGLMALVIEFKTALALLTLPAILSNVWQAFAGAHLRAILTRLRWFLLIGALATYVTQIVSQGWDDRLLTTMLGLIVMLYTGVMLAVRPFLVPARLEPVLGPPIALLTGIFSGLSGAFSIPAAVYFQSLGLKKDFLVQALGIWFLAAALSLTLGVYQGPQASQATWIISLLAVVPVLVGMRVGQTMRARLSEERFRRVFLWALCLIGGWLAFRGYFLP